MKAQPIQIDWHPSLSIYASEAFLKTVGDEYGWFGGFDPLGKLRCVLPFTIIQKSFFRLARFRVETIPIDSRLTVEEEKSFLNSVVSYLRASRTDMIIPASTNAIFRTFPDGAVAAPYGTFIIDLTQPEETLWNNLSSSHRRKLRLATKSGVKIKTGVEHLKTVYTLVHKTFKRSGLNFMAYDTFERQMMGLSDGVKVFVAEHRGTVQGGMVTPFSECSAYYVYGGSIENPIPGAMNLLHWNAIQIFRNLAVKQYDFVGVRIQPSKGSKQEGLMTFKQRFGGRLIQGYMWKYTFAPWKSVLYRLAMKSLRGGDIVDQECHKLGNPTIDLNGGPL